MLQVVRIKFSDEKLKEKLLSTGDTYICEHWPRRMLLAPDTFWADGRDGSGQNQMGRILMQVRGELGGYGEVLPPAAYWEWVKLSSY